MEKAEKPLSHLSKKSEKSDSQLDVLFKLHVLADMAEQRGPLETTQISEPRPGPVSRSGRVISVTWKVKENQDSEPALDMKAAEPRLGLVSRSRRTISVNRKVKVSSDSNLVSDKNSQEVAAAAIILVQMFYEKRYVAILEPTQGNTIGPAPVKGKGCSDETIAQRSSRKRKLLSGDMQGKVPKKTKVGPHVCEICGASFPTGVQLGGHKRAHWQKGPKQTVNRWSIRKCGDSELHFYLTIGKNDKCASSNGNDLHAH